MSGYDGSVPRALVGLYERATASDFVRKVVETFATRILLIAIGVVTSVLIARILGPEGRGLFAVAGTLSAIGVQFGNLGLHSANTYAVSRDRLLLPRLLGNSLVVSLVLGATIGVVTWVVFSWRPEVIPLPATLLALTLVSIPLSLAYLLTQNLLLGIQEVRAFNKIELSSRTLTVALITLVIVVGVVTPETVFLAGIAAGAANLAWAVWRLRPYMPEPPRPSWSLLRGNLGYGVKAYLACFFAFLVIRLDLLMVQYMRGPEQTGYYSISVSLADLLYLLPTTIGAILFPKLSAMKGRDEKWRMTTRTAFVTAGLMVALALAAVPVARPGIRLVFGEAFVPAAPAFMILAAGIVFLGVNTVFSNYLASAGMPWFAVHVWIAATVLNVGLNLALIPRFGIEGAALSSLACYLGAMLAQMIYAVGYRPDETPAEPSGPAR